MFDPTKFGAVEVKNAPVQSPAQSSGIDIMGTLNRVGQNLTPFEQRDIQSAQETGAPVPFQSGQETPLTAGLKAAQNTTQSFINFIKGLGSAAVNVLNPDINKNTILNLGRTLAGGIQSIPGIEEFIAQHASPEGKKILAQNIQLAGAVGQSLKNRYGSIENISRTAVNDPFGVGADIAGLLAGGAVAAGKGAVAANIAEKAGQAVTRPVGAITGKISQGLGKLSTEALGVTTGTGGQTIRTAFQGGSDFTAALRGKTSPNTVVENAKSAVNTIKDQRQSEYLSQLENVKSATQSLDIKPIKDELQKQLDNFKIKIKDGELDFSRSAIGNKPEAINDVTAAYQDVDNWGTQQGDRTAIGLDTLKRRLGDLYSESGQARAFIASLKNKVSNTIKQSVPEYQALTKGYEEASTLLDDIKSATSIGGRAKDETIFRKLSGAMRQNNEFRLQMVNAIQDQTGQDILGQIAGSQLNTLFPRGLLKYYDFVRGFGAVAQGLISPELIIELAATSPRIVGEFVNALGIGTRATKQILNDVNTLGGVLKSGKVPTAIPAASTSQLSDQEKAALSGLFKNPK